MPTPPKNLSSFESLKQVVTDLRGPEGCPWDKEQNHQTLTQYAIEEAHELAEAIDRGEKDNIVEELGDLLLQVVLHAEIARQNGDFAIDDVIFSITEKMVRRHPHVFSQTKVSDSQEVVKNWQAIKEEEKKAKPFRERFDVPEGLNALIRSQKIGAKTHRANFDWSHPQEVLAKVDEEISELKEAIAKGDKDHTQHELGDVLFSLAQLARHLDLDAEQSLRIANQRFERRFFNMKKIANQEDKKFETLPIEELEKLWMKAKKLTHD